MKISMNTFYIYVLIASQNYLFTRFQISLLTIVYVEIAFDVGMTHIDLPKSAYGNKRLFFERFAN